jgi:hypothetical protein
MINQRTWHGKIPCKTLVYLLQSTSTPDINLAEAGSEIQAGTCNPGHGAGKKECMVKFGAGRAAAGLPHRLVLSHVADISVISRS